LEAEIENIKKIIEELRKKDVEEEYWEREEILNKLKNEYELKLQRFKEEKEYEKIEKETKIKEMKKKIDLEKKKEFTELEKSSKLVDKLIYIIQINNFNFNNLNINN
jgi:hypothetical protein